MQAEGLLTAREVERDEVALAASAAQIGEDLIRRTSHQLVCAQAQRGRAAPQGQRALGQRQDRVLILALAGDVDLLVIGADR